ncbi:MAG: hypothetical protein ACJ74J_15305 [Blastocatellia bacterium]
MEMSTLDQKAIHAILREIDTRLSQGLVPVHNEHLQHLVEGDTVEYLLYLKRLGLISGDLVTRGLDSTPHRMTNIRLTFIGIRTLRAG